MNDKQKTTVALIFGGRGFERDVSLKGAEFVFPLIDRARYNPIPIHVTKVGDWLTDPEVFSGTAVSSAHPARLTLAHFPARQNKKGGIRSEDGRFLPIDLCLPLLHGDHGEDGEIQGTLDTAGIPYVGCGVSAGAIATDKAYTKIIAEHLGIPTVPWLLFIASRGLFDPEELYLSAEKKLSYPMIVKPARLGSSFGISRVNNREELTRAAKSIISLGQSRILIESFIPVLRELECALLDRSGDRIVTSPGEIRPNAPLYGFDEKYSSSTPAIIKAKAEISQHGADLLKNYSRILADYLGVRGLCRIDFFESADGKIYFNEINTLPGFSGGSLYPRMIAAEGIGSVELISALIDTALGTTL